MVSTAQGCMKRAMDIGLGAGALVVFAIPIFLVAVLVRLTSRGPALYWSRRVGKDNQIFWMAKFRSMRTDAPQLATHLLTDSRNWITPLGRILRATSLDELPQLFNILSGEMSFVGPRPALFNQDDLVAQRTACGVHELLPGLTGWAQVNGRDELEIPEKVAFDQYYLQHQSMLFDLRILVLTFVKVLRRDGIKQADESLRQPRSKRAA
jgi:O-antigen biosynthesis protein WbqP